MHRQSVHMILSNHSLYSLCPEGTVCVLTSHAPHLEQINWLRDHLYFFIEMEGMDVHEAEWRTRAWS